MLICTDSSQFHCPGQAYRGPWVEVNCPLSAEHPVRQTIVLHSVCVCVCVSVFGVGLGALPELRESFFHPTACRLPAGIADRNKTLNLCQIKRRKDVGTQLVKREGKTNTFPWTLERKIYPKLTNDWNGRVIVNYFERKHVSVFYDIHIKVCMFANRNIFRSSQVWKECVRQAPCIFAR